MRRRVVGDDPRTAQKKGGKKSGTRRCLALAIGKHLWGGSPPGENFLVVWVVVFLLSASLVFRSVVLVLGAVVRPSGLVVCFRLPGPFLSVFQKGDDPRSDLSARHLLTPVVQECDMLWPWYPIVARTSFFYLIVRFLLFAMMLTLLVTGCVSTSTFNVVSGTSLLSLCQIVGRP